MTAGMRAHLFRSAEGARRTAAPPALLGRIPFVPNLVLAAALSRGRVGLAGRVASETMPVGRAIACARVTDPRFPAGLALDFALELALPEGTFVAVGACTVLGGDAGGAGLVHASCALRLTAKPVGVRDGWLASLSTFAPAPARGSATGSWWMLQYLDDGA